MSHFPICLNLTFFSLNLFLCWSPWKIYRPEILSLSKPRDAFGILKTCHGVPIKRLEQGLPKMVAMRDISMCKAPESYMPPFFSLLPRRKPPPIHTYTLAFLYIFFLGKTTWSFPSKALANYPPFSFSKNTLWLSSCLLSKKQVLPAPCWLQRFFSSKKSNALTWNHV